MSPIRFQLWMSVGMLMFLSGGTIAGASAQDGDSITQSRTVIESTTKAPDPEGSSSSSTTVETSGVGFKGANAYNPKYKQRIGTYSEQIEMGLNKGWLTAAEGAEFKRRLDEMKTMEAAAAANGWAKADVDKVEKVFTTFNIDLSNASNKKPASTSTTPAATTAKPVDTVAGGDSSGPAKSTTTKTTTKKKTPVKSKTKAKSKAK